MVGWRVSPGALVDLIDPATAVKTVGVKTAMYACPQRGDRCGLVTEADQPER